MGLSEKKTRRASQENQRPFSEYSSALSDLPCTFGGSWGKGPAGRTPIGGAIFLARRGADPFRAFAAGDSCTPVGRRSQGSSTPPSAQIKPHAASASTMDVSATVRSTYRGRHAPRRTASPLAAACVDRPVRELRMSGPVVRGKSALTRHADCAILPLSVDLTAVVIPFRRAGRKAEKSGALSFEGA